jgi:phenylacetate-CoA ligase
MSMPTCSPARGGRTYARVYRRLLWPSWERLVRGRTTPQHLQFLETMQWRSPEVIERYQLHALRALLTHAGERIPYWRETFGRLRFDPRDVRRREDLAALPVLTRDVVRERYVDLVDPIDGRLNLKKGTSGSTGAPLKFEYCRSSESWRQAVRIRGYSWSGYRPGLPVFYYWGLASERLTGMAGMKVRLDRMSKREVFVNSICQDEPSRWSALERLRRMRPAAIVCFSQSCAQFARWILDKGLRDWDDIPVLCGAEAVLPADRAALSRAFGPHVFETYGSRETMLIATECEVHAGLHLSEENLLVEIARNGRPAPLGETADVLVTDLHNYGMPFIRYQNGDIARMMAPAPAAHGAGADAGASADAGAGAGAGASAGAGAGAGADSGVRCGCGRGLRKLERVEGRRADTLRDREGNPIPGIVFHVLFADAHLEVVRQFQAVQRAAGDVVLRVVRGPHWSQERFDTVVRPL